jgi:hypothetical protein
VNELKNEVTDSGEGQGPGPSVWVVIVLYESYDDTRDCLVSLAAATWPDLKVVVVDNGSGDGSGERLRLEFPDIMHMRSDENLGFAGGCNIGIKAALDAGAVYICLLNNDTIVDPGFIEPLVSRAEQQDEAGIFSGKIYYAQPDDIIWFAGGEIDRNRGFTSHRGQDQRDSGVLNAPGAVDYITGCLFFVRAELFERIGLLDERFFMYCEEVDFCLRAARDGSSCYYEPESVIRHRISRSMGGAYRPLFYYYQTRNLMEVYRVDDGAGRYSLSTLRYWRHLVLGQSLTMLRAQRRHALPYIGAIWAGFFDYMRGHFGRNTRNRSERGGG